MNIKLSKKDLNKICTIRDLSMPLKSLDGRIAPLMQFIIYAIKTIKKKQFAILATRIEPIIWFRIPVNRIILLD